jgi:hypothetical protein
MSEAVESVLASLQLAARIPRPGAPRLRLSGTDSPDFLLLYHRLDLVIPICRASRSTPLNKDRHIGERINSGLIKMPFSRVKFEDELFAKRCGSANSSLEMSYWILTVKVTCPDAEGESEPVSVQLMGPVAPTLG